MPKAQSTADRIRAARAKEGLSQAGAAKAWGINKRTLQGWEVGKEPQGLYLEKLERILRRIEK